MIHIKRKFETLEIEVILRGVPSIPSVTFLFPMELIANNLDISDAYSRLKQHGLDDNLRIHITRESRMDFNVLRELVSCEQSDGNMITCIYSYLWSRNLVSMSAMEIEVPLACYNNDEVRLTFSELAYHLEPTEFRNRRVCRSTSETTRLFFRLQNLIHDITKNKAMRIVRDSILA